MANREHLDILKQGVMIWNRWREAIPDVRPDLSGADLSRADLRGAHLNFVDLSGADLIDAHLSGAYLIEAKLIGAHLSYATFSEAFVWGTIFADVDLRQVRGLDTVNQDGAASEISIRTIYRSKGDIPASFLRGAGVPDSFIEYMHSLVGNPIEYFSCFISYSSKDETFVRRLYNDLQGNNVRCWFAPEDLRWGEKTRYGIDEAIRLHDKLLLVLSKNAIASGWVEHEVKLALAKERKEKRKVLFPVRLDQAVLESSLAWATEIRHERNIGNFTGWKEHDRYQAAFTRLLRDLKAST